ncbi:MAG: Hvo_1808 family surface protein [Halorhabdus sp.]
MVARTSVLAALVALTLISVPLAGAIASPQSAPTSSEIDSSATTGNTTNESTDIVRQQQPPDPDEDVLGWEAGYWYNETIDVTPEDGLNDSELEAVVARGMARVEKIRQLEFDEHPPVEVISRETYREEVANRTSKTTDAQRLHQNVKWEALFMVNETTDATSVQENNQAGGVGGYYDSSSGEIKIVSENTSTPKMNEITLAQELFHALQDQKFNMSSYNQSTQELHNAKDGIIEGDGNYVDHLYQERCENEWEGTCIMPNESAGSSDFEPHFGLYQILLQPYSDGPAFVQEIREEGGWEAVNAVYENPPQSTEQTIHPEKYGVDEPTNVSVPDESDERWRVLEINNSIDFASFGEAGLYVTLWYPGVELSKQRGITTDGVIPFKDYDNDGPDSQIDPYNYAHNDTAGWDGDKLVPYVTDDSFETNETGYVYKTVWDTPEDAAEFQEAYEELLDIHDAEPVDGHLGTYEISEDDDFGDAFYLNRTGKTLVIVNAPSVEELSGVRAGAAPEGERTTPSESTTTSGPGFGILATIAGVLALAVGLLGRGSSPRP